MTKDIYNLYLIPNNEALQRMLDIALIGNIPFKFNTYGLNSYYDKYNFNYDFIQEFNTTLTKYLKRNIENISLEVVPISVIKKYKEGFFNLIWKDKMKTSELTNITSIHKENYNILSNRETFKPLDKSLKLDLVKIEFNFDNITDEQVKLKNDKKLEIEKYRNDITYLDQIFYEDFVTKQAYLLQESTLEILRSALKKSVISEDDISLVLKTTTVIARLDGIKLQSLKDIKPQHIAEAIQYFINYNY